MQWHPLQSSNNEYYSDASGRDQANAGVWATPKKENLMMNKNTVLGWATLIMVIVGCSLIALGAFRYDDVAGWGFAAVGIGFFAIAWVFNALKGRM